MARYREKDETDLRWNRIRRQVTRDFDTRMLNQREKLLNDLLSVAWDKFAAALETGDSVELQDPATSWVDTVLEQYLSIEVKSSDS